MLDFREFGRLAESFPPLPGNNEFLRQWNDRGEAVRRVLGDTVEPGMVHAFSWKDYLLPRACALTYAQGDGNYLYMTLGLTQPRLSIGSAYPWEFCVRAKERADWAIDLLYQLLSQWHWEKGDMWFGYHLPLRFFVGEGGKLWPSIADDHVPLPQVTGAIRGIHLWTDLAGLQFKMSSGEFGLLTAVAVTEDEDRLANETTPAHLMLFLRRMGVSQVCDPSRTSALQLPEAQNRWKSIKHMSHDDAFDELRRSQSLSE